MADLVNGVMEAMETSEQGNEILDSTSGSGLGTGAKVAIGLGILGAGSLIFGAGKRVGEHLADWGHDQVKIARAGAKAKAEARKQEKAKIKAEKEAKAKAENSEDANKILDETK